MSSYSSPLLRTQETYPTTIEVAVSRPDDAPYALDIQLSGALSDEDLDLLAVFRSDVGFLVDEDETGAPTGAGTLLLETSVVELVDLVEPFQRLGLDAPRLMRIEGVRINDRLFGAITATDEQLVEILGPVSLEDELEAGRWWLGNRLAGTAVARLEPFDTIRVHAEGVHGPIDVADLFHALAHLDASLDGHPILAAARAIAPLGDHVDVHMLWEVFEPAPAGFRPKGTMMPLDDRFQIGLFDEGRVVPDPRDNDYVAVRVEDGRLEIEDRTVGVDDPKRWSTQWPRALFEGEHDYYFMVAPIGPADLLRQYGHPDEGSDGALFTGSWASQNAKNGRLPDLSVAPGYGTVDAPIRAMLGHPVRLTVQMERYVYGTASHPRDDEQLHSAGQQSLPHGVRLDVLSDGRLVTSLWTDEDGKVVGTILETGGDGVHTVAIGGQRRLASAGLAADVRFVVTDPPDTSADDWPAQRGPGSDAWANPFVAALADEEAWRQTLVLSMDIGPADVELKDIVTTPEARWVRWLNALVALSIADSLFRAAAHVGPPIPWGPNGDLAPIPLVIRDAGSGESLGYERFDDLGWHIASNQDPHSLHSPYWVVHEFAHAVFDTTVHASLQAHKAANRGRYLHGEGPAGVVDDEALTLHDSDTLINGTTALLEGYGDIVPTLLFGPSSGWPSALLLLDMTEGKRWNALSSTGGGWRVGERLGTLSGTLGRTVYDHDVEGCLADALGSFLANRHHPSHPWYPAVAVTPGSPSVEVCALSDSWSDIVARLPLENAQFVGRVRAILLDPLIGSAAQAGLSDPATWVRFPGMGAPTGSLIQAYPAPEVEAFLLQLHWALPSPGSDEDARLRAWCRLFGLWPLDMGELP